MVYYVNKFLKRDPERIPKAAKFIARKVEVKWKDIENDTTFDTKIDKDLFNPKDVAIIVIGINI